MRATLKRREAGAMAETKAHAEWMKENTVVVKARLQRSTDADILQYLDGKSQAAEIKKGLRLLIEQEKEER